MQYESILFPRFPEFPSARDPEIIGCKSEAGGRSQRFIEQINILGASVFSLLISAKDSYQECGSVHMHMGTCRAALYTGSYHYIYRGKSFSHDKFRVWPLCGLEHLMRVELIVRMRRKICSSATHWDVGLLCKQQTSD